MRRVRVLMLAAGLAAGLLVAPSRAEPWSTPTNLPAAAVEKKYFKTGPWKVAFQPDAGCCDGLGNAFAVYRPAGLGAGRTKHPVITWANGTDTRPEDYDYFLRHLASWGFVVVASREGNTLNGSEVLDAARFVINASRNRKSEFFDKIDTTAVGAMGHSQGATGAINAMKKSGGAIKTVVTFHLPNSHWGVLPNENSTPPVCTADPASCVDSSGSLAGGIKKGSIFFVTGTEDWQVASMEESDRQYAAVPGGIPKAKAYLEGTHHADIHGSPGCPSTLSACFSGVHGYLGYSTAWMLDRLVGDAPGRSVFVRGGELFGNTKNWRGQATANIDPRPGR